MLAAAACGVGVQPEMAEMPESPARARAVTPGYCGTMCQPGFWRHAGVAEVQAALAQGVDLMAGRGLRGGTALHTAAANAPRTEPVAALLDAGADIEYRSAELGNTPLIAAAALNGNPAVAALLLERGADIRARNSEGRTALHAAAAFNLNPAVSELLLEAGADIEEMDAVLGVTALHASASLNPNPAVTAALLDAGADLHPPDGERQHAAASGRRVWGQPGGDGAAAGTGRGSGGAQRYGPHAVPGGGRAGCAGGNTRSALPVAGMVGVLFGSVGWRPVSGDSRFRLAPG